LESLSEASPAAKEVISALNFDATQNIDEKSQNDARQALNPNSEVGKGSL
jgi:hypothetical protein